MSVRTLAFSFKKFIQARGGIFLFCCLLTFCYHCTIVHLKKLKVGCQLWFGKLSRFGSSKIQFVLESPDIVPYGAFEGKAHSFSPSIPFVLNNNARDYKKYWHSIYLFINYYCFQIQSPITNGNLCQNSRHMECLTVIWCMSISSSKERRDIIFQILWCVMIHQFNCEDDLTRIW